MSGAGKTVHLVFPTVLDEVVDKLLHDFIESAEHLQGTTEEDGTLLTRVTFKKMKAVPAKDLAAQYLLPKGIAHECREMDFLQALPLDELGNITRRTHRFTAQGGLQTLDITANSTNPPLGTLMHILDTTGRAGLRQAKLEAYIRKHHASVTPLPWKNQVEFGKVYRARQLITPRSG